MGNAVGATSRLSESNLFPRKHASSCAGERSKPLNGEMHDFGDAPHGFSDSMQRVMVHIHPHTNSSRGRLHRRAISYVRYTRHKLRCYSLKPGKAAGVVFAHLI